MINKKPSFFSLKSFVLLFILFLSICSVCAHQPRVETGANTSIQDPIDVQNPEISRAFYGQLKGNPDYYRITSDKPFELYINLLVPAGPGIGGSFPSAEVTDSSGEIILTLNGTNSIWEPYFEEFGGDNYLKGPEATKNVPAGTYIVKVFNSNNQGKYSIAIGKIEAFPVDESINTIIALPILKEQFFGKPVTTLFFEFVGIILALGSTMVLFIMLIKARKSEELTQLTLKVNGALRLPIWIGIIITTIVWAVVMFQNPLNILGLLNSLLLIILIVLSWYVGSKMSKIEFRKLPFVSMTVYVILWWIFTFLTINVI